MKKTLISGGIVIALALAGCQGDEGARGNNGYNNTGNVDQVGYHNTTRDDMTNNRNYTMQRNSDRYQNSNWNMGNRYHPDGHFTGPINNPNITEGNRNGNRGNNINTRNVNDNNDNRYEIAREAADKITDKVKGIESAYVITTDNNAYVAAELDNDNKRGNNNRNNDRFDDQLSDEVKNKISKIVKSVNKDIDNVYVSTNPDFLDLTNNYANDVERGEPIEGFFDQFSNMIERIFPQNK